MKNLKITIIGCSVAIRIRPPKKYPENNNYGTILEKKLSKYYPDKCIILNNFGFSRATIREIRRNLENYITTFPDYFILNIGVPDASTREIPFWYAQILNKKKNNPIKSILGFFHSKIIKKFNAFFVKLRLKRTWISKKEFQKTYESILKFINKEANAKVICLAINKTNKRVENKIPGSEKNYKTYNKIIEKTAKKLNAYYLNFDNLSIEKYFPDGIHYSSEGHKYVAQKIFEIIT